ncbi:MAG: PH domain-containing protein [Acidimicrobiia bacterium]|nr:PH domain-containing protein [Acidimicrobiia bacterium]
MSEAERLLAEPSRQSPLAVIFLAWRLLRQISLVNLIVLGAVVSSGRLPVSGAVLVLLAALALGVMGGLSWWRFVFVVTDGELRVSRGVLSEEKLAIPLNRVQTVSLEQGLLHQILNLTKVAVDTAGSTETEFKFDALERRRAEALRQVVSEHRSGGVPGAEAVVSAGSSVAVSAPPPTGPRSDGPPPPPGGVGVDVRTEVIARRSVVDLVKIGLSSWPWAGLVFIIPLIAALDELRELLDFPLLDQLSQRVEEVGQDGGPEVSVSVLVASVVSFILVVTLAGWALQVVRSIITNWELTLTRTTSPAGDSLRRDAGLFNRTSLAANLRRVQGVRSTQSPMQRWFGIRRLVLSITGEADLAVPGSTDAEFDRIESLVFDGERPVADRVVSRAWVWLEARNRALSLIAPTIVVAVLFGWWALLAAAPLASGVIGAHLSWRRYRWGFTDRRLAVRAGFLTHRTHDVEFIKAQSVDVRRSFFQRRRGLATFRLQTAEEGFEVHMITESEANALRDLVLYHVESSGRSWM